jgi:hypothetical protein
MKTKIYIFIFAGLCLWSCQKTETVPLCRLNKFITEYPATNLIHHDLISIKNNRIEKVYSYDLKNGIDTIARQRIIYVIDALGKLS